MRRPSMALIVAVVAFPAVGTCQRSLTGPLTSPLLLRSPQSGCVVCVSPLPSEPHASVDDGAPQGASSGRSTGTAVAISIGGGLFGIHGLGSYYAGDSAHGTRHLLIGLVSVGVMAAGLATCDSGFGVPSIWESGCGDTSRTLSALGALSYLGNWGWSTVVAARDVRRHNERLRGATIALAPRLEVRSGEAYDPWSGEGPHTDARVFLRIVEIGF